VASGEVVLTVKDIDASGFGTPWGHTRSCASRLSEDTDIGNGTNWQVEEWPYLVIQADKVVVMGASTQEMWFTKVGDSFVPQFSTRETLVLDTVNNVYRLIDLHGGITTYSAATGVFQRYTDPAGNTVWVEKSHDTEVNFLEVRRTFTVNGSTTIESFLYTYDDSKVPPLLMSVLLCRQVDGGPWTNVSRATYGYLQGDLESVTTQDWNGTDWETTGTTFYRHYAPSSSSSSGSAPFAVTDHLPKYVLSPASYAKMAADIQDPSTAPDNILASYADQYFEYNDNRQVTKLVTDGGTMTHLFSYAQSAFPDGYNSWKYKTTEILPDNSQSIVYANYAGQTMLRIFKSAAGEEWSDFYQYTTDGLVSMHANPSAIRGDSTMYEQYADLMHYVNGSYQYLGLLAGLIETFQYHVPTGYLTDERIQNGQGGTPISLRHYQYAALTSTPPVYFLSQQSQFPAEAATPQIVTSYVYTLYPGTAAVQQRVTRLPIIFATQNGSGVEYFIRDHFDTYGNLTWHMDERGFLTNSSYDIATGAVIQRIDDVNTAMVAGPPGWSTPADGGQHLITDITNDSQGRPTQVLGPLHSIDVGGVPTMIRRATWNVYKNNLGSLGQEATVETRSALGYATGTSPNYTYTVINPVSIAITDMNGRPLQQIQAKSSATNRPPLPSDVFTQADYVRWTTQEYLDHFHLSWQRVYRVIPLDGDIGNSEQNFDQTDFDYDVMFRTNKTETPGGTITRTVFDPRSNPMSTWVGTDDSNASDNDPTGGGAAGNNMTQVSAFQYDTGLVGGDNNLTQDSRYVDASTIRVTNFIYDWRNRRTDTQGPLDFYEKVYYDNLDRIVKTERYNTSLSGNLVARGVVHFDDLSRVYQTLRYGVDPATGTAGYSLVDNNWYDPSGNLLMQLPAGSKLFTKNVYDSLGRSVTTYAGYTLVTITYPEAGRVTNDTILEQVESAFDEASNLIQTTTRQRYHNASGLGALGLPTGTQPLARVTYTAIYPDAIGRVQAGADYGTNGGIVLARPAIIPARSDTVLVSSSQFDADSGDLASTTDPAGKTIQFSYDHVGREVKRILNYAGSSSPAGACAASLDSNVTIATAYNADGNITLITAHNSQTGDQRTQFNYGTTLTDSGIASTLLKRSEVYPDSANDSDHIAFTYNRQGEIATKIDQLGTQHTYDYDLLGRLVQDRIKTVGTGVDGAVLRIENTYEVRGMLLTATSYDNATVGQGNIVNQVQLTYNEFAQLVVDYQSHAGAVNVASTPSVHYGHTHPATNTIRPTVIVYPNGRRLNFGYGATNSIDDAASRVASLVDSDGATHLADYSYLGRGSVVILNSPQPGLKYTLVGNGGGTDPDTGDIYQGLDRFGRIKDLIWQQTTTSTILERIQHGYDRVGNRLNRVNLADPARKHDELYHYDGLDRLHDLGRGTLNAPGTAISVPTFGQCWTLDETGNWTAFRQDDDGNGTWDLVQSRTSNPVNEITSITNTAGPAWVKPAYDAAGNMTTVPHPASPGSSFTAVYDAWNRLTSLTYIAEVFQNQYDGLNRRVATRHISTGTLIRHFYYSAVWQVLEQRFEPSTNPDRQFVWGIRYIDDLVLRDRDATGSGTLDERLYALQDPNWNVTALVDPSGVVQERYSYEAYGAPRFLAGDFGDRGESQFDWETLYASYRWDSETEMYHIRARTYGPKIGTWLQRDPLAIEAGDSNLYRYVKNAPTYLNDASGLDVQLTCTADPGMPSGKSTWWPDVRKVMKDPQQGQYVVTFVTGAILLINQGKWTYFSPNTTIGKDIPPQPYIPGVGPTLASPAVTPPFITAIPNKTQPSTAPHPIPGPSLIPGAFNPPPSAPLTGEIPGLSGQNKAIIGGILGPPFGPGGTPGPFLADPDLVPASPDLLPGFPSGPAIQPKGLLPVPGLPWIRIGPIVPNLPRLFPFPPPLPKGPWGFGGRIIY
jgi:RHS repeat-associated protein